MPHFSVVIPAYNRADTILPTLQSVQSQSFADFECLVIDDGSKDGAALREVVEGMKDPRFQYIHRENGGGGAARNTGIMAAKGDYIAFLDSDDFFLSEKLSTDYALLETYSGPNDIVFSQIKVDRGLDKMWIKPPRAPHTDEPIDHYLICDRGFIQTSTIVMPTPLAQSVLFDENLSFGQDTDFCIRLAYNGAHFHMHSAPLVIWDDQPSTARVSSSAKYLAQLDWTDRIAPMISRRSYLVYRGWHVARMAAPHQPLTAAGLYFKALITFAFSPKMAVIAGLQVLLPRRVYRAIADLVVKIKGS